MVMVYSAHWIAKVLQDHLDLEVLKDPQVRKDRKDHLEDLVLMRK
jgi:hypothetical protein